MHRRPGRRKPVGSILHRYYNLEGENSSTSLKLKGDTFAGHVTVEVEEQTEDAAMREETTMRKEATMRENNDNPATEGDELDCRSRDFNASEYFRRLLEESSLEDLISKSKKIEREIKQNDNFMQSVVYENYKKFIDAADAITFLKGNFKHVREKIKKINEHITHIDDSSNKVNRKVCNDLQKMENIINIKKVLHDVNTIMKMPKRMFSQIARKDYITALRMFIDAVPFFFKNRHLSPFLNLYLDCNNLANIACYFYLKMLKHGGNSNGEAAPHKGTPHKGTPHKGTPHKGTPHKGTPHKGTPHKGTPHKGGASNLQEKSHFKEGIYTMHGSCENEEGNPFPPFNSDNLGESFELLHLHVVPSEEIMTCLYVVLAYGKSRKKVRNLYVYNRIMAIKFMLCSIFNLHNYEQFEKKREKFVCTLLTADSLQYCDDNYKKDGCHGDKPNTEMYNKNFETVFDLAYIHLVHFFFGILDCFEKLFIRTFSDANMSLGGGISRIRRLIRLMEEHVKNGENRESRNSGERELYHLSDRFQEKFTRQGSVSPETLSPNDDSEKEGITQKIYPQCDNLREELTNIWVEDEDKKIVEVLAKGFFKALLKLTIDFVYMFSPPIKIVLLSLKRLVDFVKRHERYKVLMKPILRRFTKKLYFTHLKLYFYNLCFTSSLRFGIFFNVCNSDINDTYLILNRKKELGHTLLLSLCLTLIDLEIFYEHVHANTIFYFKNLINFVLIYFIFLTKFVNCFMSSFVCVSEKKTRRLASSLGHIDKGYLDIEKEQHMIHAQNAQVENEKREVRWTRGDSSLSREPLNDCTHFGPNSVTDDDFSEDIYTHERGPFRYKSIYEIANSDEVTNEDVVGNQSTKWNKLARYLYNCVDVNHGEMHKHLKNAKKFMKLDYERFIDEITQTQIREMYTPKGEEDALGRGVEYTGKKGYCSNVVDLQEKEGEVHFLLSMVCILESFKRESIPKIFTIILDLYKDAHALVKEDKQISLRSDLTNLLYTDAYPLCKRGDDSEGGDVSEGGDEDTGSKMKGRYTRKCTATDKRTENSDDGLMFDVSSPTEGEEKGNIFVNEMDSFLCGSGEEKKFKMKSYDAKMGYEEWKERRKVKGEIINGEDDNSNGDIFKRDGRSKETVHEEMNREESKKKKKVRELITNGMNNDRDYFMSDAYCSGDDDEDEKEKCTRGICSFVKYKFRKKCSEMMNVYISYCVNKLWTNMKLYLEEEKWIEVKKVKLVSNNFMYCFQNVNYIYSCLSSFFDPKGGGKYNQGDHNEVYIKIKRGLERICEKKVCEVKAFEKEKKIREESSQGALCNTSLSQTTCSYITSPNVNSLDGQKNLEMYMYRMYMLKMKNYKKNLHLESHKIILVIIKILFKNYAEFVRTLHFNDLGLYKLKVDFAFYYHCLRYYIPADDENVLFVILNEVLINARDRVGGTCISSHSNMPTSVYPLLLLDDLGDIARENQQLILRTLAGEGGERGSG
ncbi:vacuolar protein sorting-associated protein 51, putative [Plasmodium ovale wallikeri]|uniref:Vacuolar protein sorting-associated protein 51, putative n=1 Tax=Plasmodium ovale wallikeri TaxID=864142 RepID=A0A1A8YGV3_PLAOA|nr:vacuolar protein sorting-associated protein 51, putative [Plasmodium ovale wallikeri]SBT31386.1 vacuolar protein sorting-associated protein 51, putative [Plasmodium ovale wallikeri]